MHTLGGRAASFVIGLATAVVIVALTIPLFLNPLWVAFEQGRAGATSWTGFSEPQLRAATDAILADLVVGPPDFGVDVAGAPVLNERERGHMRDVRGVFAGFFALTAVLAAAAFIIAARRRKDPVARAASWRAVRNGAGGLIVALLAVGSIAFIAFDVLFELFHRLLFAGGSYSFDPATERLVQLFPFGFWQETAIALGVVAILVAIVVAVVAHGRAEDAERSVVAGPPATTANTPATQGSAR